MIRRSLKSLADRRLSAALALVLATTACTQPIGVPRPTTLNKSWTLGVEAMRDDPGPQLPLTNRFFADLSAMPKLNVVYVRGEQDSFHFNVWQGDKVLVSSWLHGQGNCMNVTYTIFQSGQQQAVFGLVVPPMPAGVEPDSACVDRAATQFYQAMVLQGM